MATAAAADYAASANPTNNQCLGYSMLFYLSFSFVLNNNNNNHDNNQQTYLHLKTFDFKVFYR